MANYQETRVKLTNKQLNKLKLAVESKTGTTLRANKNNFGNEELSYELFLTTRQTARIRKAFANKMLTFIRLSKTQISKIIQSAGYFGSWWGNLGKKVLTNVTVSSARDNLPGLVSHLAANAIDKFERKISDKGAVRAGKWFTLLI